jgi:GeoRSP system SPASM domain protein
MELSSPITIFWDLPDTLKDVPLLERFAAEIIASRPLMLQLRAGGNNGSDGLLSLLAMFSGTPLTVSLTVNHQMLSDPLSLEIANYCREVLFSCGHTGEVQAELMTESIKRYFDEMAKRIVAGVSFPVCAGNWRELPGLLRFCREQHIKRLVLPMQRLYDVKDAFYLSRQEQMELKNQLALLGQLEGMDITIHDPFVWRVFYPDTPFPQGGCQAANTMLAIDHDGGVYPCPSLPVRIGELTSTSLREIIRSAEKKGLRQQLLRTPVACGECIEERTCLGGCRGRGYLHNGSMEGADPSCEAWNTMEKRL